MEVETLPSSLGNVVGVLVLGKADDVVPCVLLNVHLSQTQQASSLKPKSAAGTILLARVFWLLHC